HFYSDDPGVELAIRAKDGNVTFERIAGTARDEARRQAQIDNADERLKTDSGWRWRLLRNLCQGIQQFSSDPSKEKRDFAAQMDRVRAALAARIARKGHT